MNRLSFVAGAAAAFVISAASWSVLQSAPVAPAAADQTLGMALMSAVVASNGTLIRGSGATGVTTASINQYNIAFDRSVTNCTYSTSIVNAFAGSLPFPGVATATTVSDPNQIVVATYLHDGSALQLPFHLQVYCSR